MPLKNALIAIGLLVCLFLVATLTSAFLNLPENDASGYQDPQENDREISSDNQKKTTLQQKVSDVSVAPVTKSQEPAFIPASAQPLIRAHPDIHNAIVSIQCVPPNANYPLGGISGSGVIIDSRGVVLTNAHIGQYFLLPTHISCWISTPHTPSALQAEVLFLPPTWVEEHADELTMSTRRGTGENDYALLRITNISPNSTFAFLAPDPLASIVETTITEDGFEEEYVELSVGTRLTALATPHTASESEGEIISLFTFDTDFVDMIELTTTNKIAQRGSSGGAVIGTDKLLKALIVSIDTQHETVRAITLGHINKSLETHAHTNLSELLNGNIEQKARMFAEKTAPVLQQQLSRYAE